MVIDPHHHFLLNPPFALVFLPLLKFIWIHLINSIICVLIRLKYLLDDQLSYTYHTDRVIWPN